MENILMNNEVPAETFLKYLIRDNKILKKENSELKEQLGKERAYIEELEEKINSLENTLMQERRNYNEYKIEHKKFYKSIKKEDAYKEIREEFENKEKKRKEKISELNKKLEILMFNAGKWQDKIKLYETKFGTI